MTILDYENPRLEGINVTVPLRSESGDLYSFVLNLSADGYGTKGLATNAIANAQVCLWRLGHIHTPSPGAASPAKSLPVAAEGVSSGVASAECKGSAARKRGTFTSPTHVACCRAADGRGYP